MLQIKILRRLAAVAGLWTCASAALAAPPSATSLPVGQVALPPAAFIDFCRRQPQDCGEDVSEILVGVRRAEAERAALMTPAFETAATASVGQAKDAAAEVPALQLLPVEAPATVLVERAEDPRPVTFIDPAEAARLRAPAVAWMTPDLWSKLNRINNRVNNAIQRATDLDSRGVEDSWDTPLRNGQLQGDCEDYVLEKRRALLDAGVSPRALNIAVVTTTWGETHAVLLVATHKGEFVLDNLSSWVLPWREAPYRWRQRQVDGQAFNWAMAAPSQDRPAGRLRMASLR